MSGGSYNYAYSRIDELAHWAKTLEDMASDCRSYVANTKTVHAGVDERHCVKHRPADDIDRAGWTAHAERLEAAAKKVREAAAAVEALADLMKGVEWVESGDDPPSQLNPERTG
jgi:hypothetical protein